ncbi:hypothetical protein DL93DRAFT_2062114 [Clavulina sp. PMI_390]|nr:hypothetical protein DL93DRAFT_2062114 [Clavulina sp. PMI_390]
MSTKPMIQIMSDLHLEFGTQYQDFDVTPSAPILALVGDIGRAVDDAFFVWLRKMLRKFEAVLLVMGNHEFYGSSYVKSSSSADADKTTPQLGEFVFLDRRSWSPPQNPNLVILGCTLWSELDPANVPSISQQLNDFYQINGMTTGLFDYLHERDCQWLEAQLNTLTAPPPPSSSQGDTSGAAAKKTVVVMSHHAPYDHGTANPVYEVPENLTRSGFSSDLSKPAAGVNLRGASRTRGPLVRSPVHTWVYGHTHWSSDTTVEGVRIVSNQRGYIQADGGIAGGNPARPFNNAFVLEF